MATIDIFANNAFSMVQLTRAIEKLDYVPDLLGRLGLFEPDYLRGTDVAMIEKRENVLSLIPVSERGAPPVQRDNDKRDIRPFKTRRIFKHDRLTASELFKIRAFGTESELMQVQAEVVRRLDQIRRDVSATWEHMRLGAVQGIVLDADGSVLDNWFDQWGIAQAGEIDFELDDADTVVRTKCHAVTRAMKRAAKGGWVEGRTTAHALAGDGFYDMLIDHPSVVRSYANWEAARALRENKAFDAFEFGGIVWHNYRGSDDNSTIAVHPDKAVFFPAGGVDIFAVAWAPGESFGTLDMPGQPIYPQVVPDRDRDQWVDLEEYSYPLFMCLRPEVLQRAKKA